MKRVSAAIAAAVVATAGLIPVTAIADPGYGSLSVVTLRDCNGAGPLDDCPGGPQRLQTVMDGGAGTTTSHAELVAAAGSPQAGSSGSASVEFGDLDLPVLHGSSYAVGDARVNGSPKGYQSYVFGGPDGTPFGLSGAFEVEDSSLSPANGLAVGGAIYLIYLAIYDADYFPHLTDAESVFELGMSSCGDASGLLAVGVASGTTPGGAFSSSVSTSSCSGGPLTLSHGQEFVTLANVALFTNRGGSIDFSHTFTTTLNADLGEETTALLRGNLVSSMDAVPEPATWGLMLLGFGGIGVCLRRGRQATRKAA